MTTPGLPTKPNIDYTSRDYISIRDDLINLIPAFMPDWISRSPNDFGIVLLELWAYVSDQMNYFADRVANEAYLSTALQRESVIRIARMMGYTPASSIAAQVALTFTNTASVSAVIPAGTQVSTVQDPTGASPAQVFETDVSLTVPASSAGIVNAHQGTTISGELVAVSTGQISQTYALYNSDVIQGSVSIVVNDGTATTWNYSSRLVTAGALDTSYSLIIDDNDITSVVFGDNANGAIPPINATITAQYRIGGGTAGNVGPSSITRLVSSLPSGITVSNQSAASGGIDPESTSSIRANAQKSFSTVQRATTLSDYATLATLVPGCGAANAVSAINTSVTVYVAPSGGGGYTGTGGTSGSLSPSFSQTINSVQSTLTTASPAGTSVTVTGPTYVPINVTVVVHVASQFVQSVVVSAATLALTNYFSFGNSSFAKTIPINDMYTILAAVPGVVFTEVDVLSTTTTGAATITLAASQFPVVGTVNVSATGGISG